VEGEGSFADPGVPVNAEFAHRFMEDSFGMINSGSAAHRSPAPSRADTEEQYSKSGKISGDELQHIIEKRKAADAKFKARQSQQSSTRKPGFLDEGTKDERMVGARGLDLVRPMIGASGGTARSPDDPFR
jgi:hypothetical protein